MKISNYPIARRTFLKTAGLLPLLTQCRAVAPAPGKNTVWLNMDQAELDAAYTQSNWAPNAREVQAEYNRRSESARERLTLRRLLYGDSSVEQLDLFDSRSKTGSSPILIFIHGGAWAGGTAGDYSFVAERFVDAGFHVVIPDFDSVKDVNGNLAVLADQVRRCIRWCYEHAQEFNGDPNRIYLAGHSSGAHLAAVALTTNWSAQGLPSRILAGGILCSGMYDLKPVRLSARSKYINFTDAMEQSLSPMRHLAQIQAPLVVSWGTKESPEFQRQGSEFVAAVKKAKLPVTESTADLNHFEVLFGLSDPDGFLAPAVKALLRI